MVQLSYPYMLNGKIIALTTWTFFSKVMSLLFKMLSRFDIAFLPRSKCFGTLENKICHCLHFLHHLYLPWSDETCWDDLSFLNVEFQDNFLCFPLSKARDTLVPLQLSIIRVVSSSYLQWLIFLPAILTAVCDSSSSAFHNVLWI